MENAWQVIVVQTRGGQAEKNSQQQYLSRSGLPQEDGLPLQITIRYGDEKVSTPLVQASQPLWNFWTQLSDKGGPEPMVFSLVERDRDSGSLSVKGEATLDLSKYRQHGQSIELWEKLQPTDAAKAPTGAGDTVAELHLTITYCPTKQDEDQGQDTDCLLCTLLGSKSQGCVIS